MEEIAINQGLVHIFEKIFLALDAKTLVNCSLVSRSLSSSLKDPRFWLKKCVEKNLIKDSFKEWNKLFKLTSDNEAKRHALTRVLKIIFMDQNALLKKPSLAGYKAKSHPLKLSIMFKEFELAEYILEKRNVPEKERTKIMFRTLQLVGCGKATLAFIRKYAQ